ncbi:hypothetical protein PPTG_19340 [Phytophthora nicotianae INRA-310]|uniref:RxLR effector protein n=1 Tax=Phytophthora nicotianae (strain INRA-310) TaxID=761204 RepID=W2PCS3_PHYN3|nr:hypothetical protein PPTG_19340 [Phytophthora nicotianae INRA-310]ETM98641.1 hypothetical protein PPTG_19340 [Phytophthora nicotianae INRA-310]
MRVTVVLLAAIAVSFASAAINADQNSLSTKTSLGLVNPIDGTLGDINNNGKRFLRRQKPSEDDDSDVGDSDVDEERINASKLKDLVNGKTRTQFTHWGDQKLSPSKVWDKLKGLSDTKRKMVYDWYYKDIYRNGNWRR